MVALALPCLGYSLDGRAVFRSACLRSRVDDILFFHKAFSEYPDAFYHKACHLAVATRFGHCSMGPLS